MLGVGMVILQPSTGKCAVVYDSKHSYWLLPKGRKDANESLETAVLREAYEEVRSLLPSARSLLIAVCFLP